MNLLTQLKEAAEKAMPTPKDDETTESYIKRVEAFVSEYLLLVTPENILKLLEVIEVQRKTLMLISAYDPKKGLVKVQPLEALVQVHFHSTSAIERAQEILEGK